MFLFSLGLSECPGFIVQMSCRRRRLSEFFTKPKRRAFSRHIQAARKLLIAGALVAKVVDAY
jgi:hypothetical protein